MTHARSLFRMCILLAVITELVQPLCVLESDFGFKINCAFKKSGLFRVRNLGGIKAHASLGFSLGDELGFEQSLTNQDPSRRRSVSFKNGAPNILVDTNKPTVKQEKRGKQNRIMMRPVAPVNRPNQAAIDKLTTLHRRVATTMQPIIVAGPTLETPTYSRPTITMAKPMPMGVPPFKPLPSKDETLKVLPIVSSKKTYSPLQLPPNGPAIIYPSENNYIFSNPSKMMSHMTAVQMKPMYRITPSPYIIDSSRVYTVPTTINPFVPLPAQTISFIQAPALKQSAKPSQTYFSSFNALTLPTTNPVSNFIDTVPHQVNDLANMYPAFNTKKVDDYNTISGYSEDTALKFNKDDIDAKIAEIAKVGNISMEAVEAAIALRQQQLLSKYANIATPTTTSTTTTTTEEPAVFQLEPEPEIIVAPVQQKPKRNPTGSKVMNAPKEYYPVGYEKNFDDHFQSKVDLPDTNFHCGDQKYFPGLYGDESLGCMVFHVCALTDDGLVMKSFLCPESTLFDQTILKCNWWFYVDCKSTVKLYDTNIPVSKSYQLMKALTFFSSYKKEMEEEKPVNPDDVGAGVKQAISILVNQDAQPAPSNTETIYVTSLPVIDERHSNSKDYSNIVSTESPVYRGSRNYNQTSERHTRNKADPRSQKPRGFSLVRAENTTNADSISTSAENSSETTSAETVGRRKRQRYMSRNTPASTTTTPTTSTTTTTTTTTTTSTTTTKPTQSTPDLNGNSTVITPIEDLTTLEVIGITRNNQTDKIEGMEKIDATILKEAENLPAVKRFYRSSAEVVPEEINIVNNEKVQIVRPTSTAQLVGEYQTQTAAIAKLDEAVLGTSDSRLKKDIVIIERTNANETPWRPMVDRS